MKERATLRASIFALLFLAALVSGCKAKPKAGEPCTQGQGACVDPKSMMACIKGTFASTPCQGPAGCVTKDSASECDNSLSSAGDSCDEIGDYACTLDKKAALFCRDNLFVVEETCKGPKACGLKTDGLYCDNDISDPGDPCHTPGDYACTSDKKLALKCSDSRTMVPLNSCKGAKACRVLEIPEQKRVEFICDDAVADVNDPCDEDGEEACTVDRKGLLKCSHNTFQSQTACAGGCSFDSKGDKFACDQRGAVAAAIASPADGKKGAKKGKK
jgi:hypothetical protein